MTQHLSAEQISRFLVGDLPADRESHADQCPQCQARLARLEWSLSNFRSSVRSVKENDAMTTYQQEMRLYKGNETVAGLTSLLIHGGAVALILLLGTLKPVQKLIEQHVTLIAPDLSAYQPKKLAAQGGGGGGARSPLEASKGKLPEISHKQFTPPRVDTVDAHLPMVPTIIADSAPPNIVSPNYGDPLSHMGTPSNGPGFGGGIGSGNGGGVGSGFGPGTGPGSGGGAGGGVYRIGGGVSQPSIIKKVEPEYSEAARKAKWQGTVELSVIVDQTGHARDIKVAKSLGLGLDEKAMEAVAQWLFKPGMKDGKAVAVFATIQVTFHLL